MSIKVIETYIYYVIYNLTKQGYWSESEDIGYRTIHKFSKLICEAVTFDTRVKANEYLREWINIDNSNSFIVKKIKLDYSINK